MRITEGKKQAADRKCVKMRAQSAHYVKEKENDGEKCELTARRHGHKLVQRISRKCRLREREKTRWKEVS